MIPAMMPMTRLRPSSISASYTFRPMFATALPTSAQEYMQPITDSARGIVNTVYDSLLNGRK
jgi:hypothetical protein